MKNLCILLAMLFIVSSCNKNEEAVPVDKAPQSIEELEKLVGDIKITKEDVFNTPAVRANLEDCETEVLEEDFESRDCCEIDTPFNLTAGTNRFRTKIKQDAGYTIRYTVYHYVFNFPSFSSQQIASFEFKFPFNGCTTHYNIIDLDNYCNPAIIPGDFYRLSAVLYDSSNGNGCFEYSSTYFRGE